MQTREAGRQANLVHIASLLIISSPLLCLHFFRFRVLLSCAAPVLSAAAMATSLHLSLASASSLRSASSFVATPATFSQPRSAALTRRRNANLVVQAKIREIFMPALSSTMTEGKIVSWVKSEGDKLSKGAQPVGFPQLFVCGLSIGLDWIG